MMTGFIGAGMMALWIIGAKLGWAWMDGVLARRKAKPLKAPYRWVDDKGPPQEGGLSNLEKRKWP